MAFSTHNIFKAELDGVTAYDLRKQIDYEHVELSDILSNVNTVLEESEFFMQYFDGFYKTDLKKGDGLSDTNNICLLLEQLSNRILSSVENKQYTIEQREKDRITLEGTYPFLKERNVLERKMNKEIKLSEGEWEEKDAGFTNPFKKENPRKPKVQTIKASDLVRQDEVGEILRDYQTYVDFLKGLMSDEESNRFEVSHILGEINQDMILAKNQLLGVWGYNMSPSNEGGTPTVMTPNTNDLFHLTGGEFLDEKTGERKVAKGMLRFEVPKNPETEMEHAVFALRELVKMLHLSERDFEVIDMFSKGFKPCEIEKRFELPYTYSFRIVDSVARKIIKLHKNGGKKE